MFDSKFSLNPLGTVASAVNESKALLSSVDKVMGFASGNRLSASGLPSGAIPFAGGAKTQAQFASPEPKDWRVKLSIPSMGDGVFQSGILEPLKETGGLVFPYTPTVNISHTATYNTLDPVHNNYPFLAYENSRVDQITITGDFYCEDSAEARYWVAAVHYLRSVTKMAYGSTSNAGSPPPVVKLSGYGDYVFNNVPVVVKNFNLDMPKDVDYIPTGINQGSSSDSTATASKVSYAPVKSTIVVTVHPIYSREQVRQFDLDSFVKGNYLFNGKGYI